MVEAPGTAPGSTTLIPRTVYRHSRRTSPTNIGRVIAQGKGHAQSLRAARSLRRVRRRLTHLAGPRTLSGEVGNA